MKKLFFIAVVASMMFAATGCSEDATEEIKPSDPLGAEETVQAASEIQADETAASSSADTRTTLSGTDVVWTAADQIRLIKKSDTQTNSVFTLEKGAGTTTGEFRGASVGTDKFAFYPSSAYKSASGNTLTFELPAAQTYQPKSFASGANPMIGQSNAAGTIQFKNLCGVIKLQLTGTATINKIVLTVPAGKVSGTATVDAAYTGDPAPAFSDAAAKTITLTVPNVPLSTTATSFFLVVPAGDYAAGMTFEITDNLGNTLIKNTKSVLRVNRSKVAPLTAFKFNTPLNFPDPAFRAALLGAYPTQLQIADDGPDIDLKSPGLGSNLSCILTNTEINKNIKSIKGINYFSEAHTFVIEGSALTSLDASLFSQKTRIVRFSNGELTSVDFSSMANSTTITGIHLYGNRLTVVDISTLSKMGYAINGVQVGQQKTGAVTLIMNSTQQTYWTEGWSKQAENSSVTPVYK